MLDLIQDPVRQALQRSANAFCVVLLSVAIKSFMLNVIMLSIQMLSIHMLNVMLNDYAECCPAQHLDA